MGLLDRLLGRAAAQGAGVRTVTRTHVRENFKIKVPAAQAPKVEAALRNWIRDKALPFALASHPAGDYVEFEFHSESDAAGPPGQDPALHASGMSAEIQQVLENALKAP